MQKIRFALVMGVVCAAGAAAAQVNRESGAFAFRALDFDAIVRQELEAVDQEVGGGDLDVDGLAEDAVHADLGGEATEGAHGEA